MFSLVSKVQIVALRNNRGSGLGFLSNGSKIVAYEL